MKNSDIYTIMQQFGMIGEDDILSKAQFEENTKSICFNINFIDRIFLDNDEATIKKLLLAILQSNHSRDHE